MIKEEIMRKLSNLDIDSKELNDILMQLVNEGKVERYIISKKLDDSDIGVKSIIVTSMNQYDYKICFNNIRSDYRDFRLRELLLSNVKNINKL